MAIFNNIYYAYESSQALGIPFSNFQKKGDTHWTSRLGYRKKEDDPEKRKCLFMDNIDLTTKKSGAATMTVAEGYKVRLKIFTENHKYFTDNTKSTPAVNDVRIQSAGLGYDEQMEVIMFGGDYLSIDIDEEHSGIYRYRLSLNGDFYNITDPEKMNNECWIKLEEARLIDGDDEEEEAEFSTIGDGETVINVDGDTIITGSNEDTDGDGIPDYLDTDPNDPSISTILGGDKDDDDDDDEDDDDEDKKESGLSLTGLIIIGVVVLGIVFLLRMNRTSGSSNSTKSGSGGESVGE